MSTSCVAARAAWRLICAHCPDSVQGGLGWLVPVDGAPPLGWAQTVAYLVMPVLLVASQFASQKIISPPPSDDPQQQQSQAILKFLPLMIGEQPKRPSLSACPAACSPSKSHPS